MSSTMASAQGWLADEEGPLRRRILRYVALLLGVEIAGFVFFVAGTHGWIVPLHGATSTDFVSFYAAGRLADAGTPTLVYDQAAHYAAEQAATQPGILYNYFYYPPVFILVCALLARLPYLVAFVTFQVATLLPCLMVARCILRDRGWAGLVPLLAFPAVFFNLGAGQNAFLTAALLGGATLLLDRRPTVAGVLFGALCYKPHFGLLVPVALAAARYWRAFAAATVTVAALVALSFLAFGWDTWHAFLGAVAGAHTIYETRITPAGIASPFGVALLLARDPHQAYLVQAAATLAMVVTVWLVWRRVPSLPIRAAVLAAATPLAVPIVLFYDLMLSGVALLWLVRWGQERGFPVWLRCSVALLFCATLAAGNYDPQSHLLIAPLVAIGTFALAVAAAMKESGTLTPALSGFADEGAEERGGRGQRAVRLSPQTASSRMMR